ncbi:testis-expressed protein 51 [Anolis carolinensis]|uniref:testis-expressed protein 51 n=1 Tax=Anolis carolinensis TaxID=28377 RepID=UPI002F2B53EE
MLLFFLKAVFGSSLFVLLFMAKGPLIGLLAWTLPMQLAGTCLRCWPDAVVSFGYDANLLLGQDSEAARSLVNIFLGDTTSNGRRYLERDHMEREAGQLFRRIENIISTRGKEHVIGAAEEEKKNFVKKLEEASNAFMKQLCGLSCAKSRFRPYEVAHCIDCQVSNVFCNDPVVCAGANVLAGVLVTFFLLLGIGGGVWYYRRKKKAEEEEEKEDEDKEDEEKEDEDKEDEEKEDEDKEDEEKEDEDKEDEEASESSKSNEESEESKAKKPPASNIPSPPPFDIPSPPPFDIPSPPPFDIPSPPPFNIPSPPPLPGTRY